MWTPLNFPFSKGIFSWRIESQYGPMAESVECFPHTATLVQFIFMLSPLQHNAGGFPALNPDVSGLFVGGGQRSFSGSLLPPFPFGCTHRWDLQLQIWLCNFSGKKKYFTVTPFQLWQAFESQAALQNRVGELLDLEQCVLVWSWWLNIVKPTGSSRNTLKINRDKM